MHISLVVENYLFPATITPHLTIAHIKSKHSRQDVGHLKRLLSPVDLPDQLLVKPMMVTMFDETPVVLIKLSDELKAIHDEVKLRLSSWPNYIVSNNHRFNPHITTYDSRNTLDHLPPLLPVGPLAIFWKSKGKTQTIHWL